MGQYEEFKAVLDNARNEHDIDTYLKSHRELLRGIGGLYWNCMVIQPEFQIGQNIVRILSFCVRVQGAGSAF